MTFQWVRFALYANNGRAPAELSLFMYDELSITLCPHFIEYAGSPRVTLGELRFRSAETCSDARSARELDVASRRGYVAFNEHAMEAGLFWHELFLEDTRVWSGGPFRLLCKSRDGSDGHTVMQIARWRC